MSDRAVADDERHLRDDTRHLFEWHERDRCPSRAEPRARCSRPRRSGTANIQARFRPRRATDAKRLAAGSSPPRARLAPRITPPVDDTELAVAECRRNQWFDPASRASPMRRATRSVAVRSLNIVNPTGGGESAFFSGRPDGGRQQQRRSWSGLDHVHGRTFAGGDRRPDPGNGVIEVPPQSNLDLVRYGRDGNIAARPGPSRSACRRISDSASSTIYNVADVGPDRRRQRQKSGRQPVEPSTADRVPATPAAPVRAGKDATTGLPWRRASSTSNEDANENLVRDPMKSQLPPVLPPSGF